MWPQNLSLSSRGVFFLGGDEERMPSQQHSTHRKSNRLSPSAHASAQHIRL